MKERFFISEKLYGLDAMALIYTENYGPKVWSGLRRSRTVDTVDSPPLRTTRAAVDRGGLDLKGGQLKENP